MNAMNPLFQRLLGDATRLTQRGDLRGATAAIQAALGAMPDAPITPVARRPEDDAGVIDVEAREVTDSVAAREAPKVATDVPCAEPAPLADTDGGRSDGFPRNGQFIRSSHAHAAGKLDYKLFVPPGHRGQALPLIVMLHGCTQDPDDFAAGTGMNEVALEQGFFVLYPAQARNANAQRCWNWFKGSHQRRGEGEPAWIAGMTRSVIEQYGIDSKRVYVAGLSAGGAMAAIMGDTYPDIFSAIGVHSGLPSGAATDVTSAFAAMQGRTSTRASEALRSLERERTARPNAAPPTIVFHGDADTTVRPINGERVVTACMDSTPSGPGSRRITDEPQRGRSNAGREYTWGVHRDASGRVVSEHWVIHGAGHAWSGGSARGSFTDPRGPDASREMVRFFLENTRRSIPAS